MGFIRGIFGAILALLLAGFAVYNRTPVTLTYSPIHDPITLPLYLISLGLMAIGFILGGAFVWFTMGTLRKTKREQKKLIKSLEKDLKAVNENGASHIKPSSEFFPALTHKTRNAP
jgi:uncharacterized integral membrane protein